jgi:hypothetical protein
MYLKILYKHKEQGVNALFFAFILVLIKEICYNKEQFNGLIYYYFREDYI